jgi:hypothetical protein
VTSNFDAWKARQGLNPMEKSEDRGTEETIWQVRDTSNYTWDWAGSRENLMAQINSRPFLEVYDPHWRFNAYLNTRQIVWFTLRK